MINVKIKKYRQDAIVPSRESSESAGYDLHVCLDHVITIYPNQTVKLPVGLSLEIPEGWFGAIFARSGLATKKGLRPANCVSVIDSDYRGELIIPIHNDSNDFSWSIHPGERIAQVVFLPHGVVEFEETDNLSSTTRGIGGFGSTGVM